jgi:hypothetical protein
MIEPKALHHPKREIDVTERTIVSLDQFALQTEDI